MNATVTIDNQMSTDIESDKLLNLKNMLDLDSKCLEDPHNCVDPQDIATLVLKGVDSLNPPKKWDKEFVKCVVVVEQYTFYFSCAESVDEFVNMNSLWYTR